MQSAETMCQTLNSWTAEAMVDLRRGHLGQLNPNYKEINVEAELQNPDSVFHNKMKTHSTQKDHPIVVWGDYELLETNSNVFIIIARLGKKDG